MLSTTRLLNSLVAAAAASALLATTHPASALNWVRVAAGGSGWPYNDSGVGGYRQVGWDCFDVRDNGGVYRSALSTLPAKCADWRAWMTPVPTEYVAGIVTVTAYPVMMTTGPASSGSEMCASLWNYHYYGSPYSNSAASCDLSFGATSSVQKTIGALAAQSGYSYLYTTWNGVGGHVLSNVDYEIHYP